MISAIKPPGGPLSSTTPPLDSLSESASAESAPAESASAESVTTVGPLEHVTPLDTVQHASTVNAANTASSGVQGTEGIQHLAAAMRSGELQASQALDRLVQQMLTSPSAQGLNQAGRAELEHTLRHQLATNPTLQTFAAELDHFKP